MDFALTEEQRLLRQEIRRFAKAELSSGAMERDREQSFSRELWSRCAEMGLTGLCVPEEHGGSGLDPLSTAIALEAFGYGCEDGGLVFSVAAHLLACVVPAVRFGTEEQKRRYLPGFCDGSLIAANGMSEPDSGSDAFAMRTRAVRDGDHFVLDGTKTFISNAPVAEVVLVFAVTDPEKGYHGGITAFLVDRDTPGMSTSPKIEKMGLRTSPLGEVILEGCRVPESAALGGVGGGSRVFTHSMDWERICLFASHVGTMERILEQGVRHARSREQFGQAIGKFQGVSHKLAEIKIQLEAARLLVYQAAWKLGKGRGAAQEAAMAKVFVAESFLKSALETVQILGGYGFMTEYQVERVLRDAVGARIYSGSNEMQKNIIARWLGL